MRDTPHSRALISLIANQLLRSNVLDIGNKSQSEIRDSLEELTEDIVRFFSDADSYDPNWLLSEPPNEGIFRVYEMQVASFSMTYDEEEQTVADRAEGGDFHPIADLIRRRGYLRTQAARNLVSDRLKNIKQSGNPKTKINYITYIEVLSLAAKHNCSWSEAKKLWLDENLNVSSDTLKSRLTRFEKSTEGKAFKLLRQYMKKGRKHGLP